MSTPTKVPEPIAHVHSNGDVCLDRKPVADMWPVELITRADAESYASAKVAEAVEQIANKLGELDCAHRCGIGREVAAAIRKEGKSK